MQINRAKPSKREIETNRVQHGFMTNRIQEGDMILNRYHAHPEIELNWVVNGTLEYLHRSKYYRLKSGELGLFWGNYAHSIHQYSSKVDLIWITIPLSNFDHPYFLNSLRKLLMEGAFLVIDSAFDRPTENYWSHLSKNIRAGGALKEVALLEIQALLSRWIIENPTEKKKRTDLHFSDSRSFKKIQHLLAKISETYRQEIGVDALAQAVGLNPQYMMRLFYKTMGMTVHQFILQSRINEAKRLLIASDLKIIDVAHDCGFNSLSAFYTAFGKLTEMTPLDFRRKTHQ